MNHRWFPSCNILVWQYISVIPLMYMVIELVAALKLLWISSSRLLKQSFLPVLMRWNFSLESLWTISTLLDVWWIISNDLRIFFLLTVRKIALTPQIDHFLKMSQLNSYAKTLFKISIPCTAVNMLSISYSLYGIELREVAWTNCYLLTLEKSSEGSLCHKCIHFGGARVSKIGYKFINDKRRIINSTLISSW